MTTVHGTDIEIIAVQQHEEVMIKFQNLAGESVFLLLSKKEAKEFIELIELSI